MRAGLYDVEAGLALKEGREWKEHALRLVFAILACGGSLRSVGIDAPRMVRALDSVVPMVQTAAHETDALLEAEDGSLWHFEFQFGGQEQVARRIRYHLAVVERYPSRVVHTVILWGERQSPASLVVGEVSFGARQVLLRQAGGERLLEDHGSVVAEDAAALALLPLMRVRRSMPDLIVAAEPLVAALDPNVRKEVMGALGTLAYRKVEPGERPRVLEVLRKMALTPNVFEDLEALVRKEAQQEAQREAVLDVFDARFGSVPEAVKAAVAGQTNAARLQAWHRGVARAKDQAEAVGVVLGEGAAR